MTRRTYPDALPGGANPITQVETLAAWEARIGCRRLLEAHLRTGCHWISDPALLKRAVAELGA